MVCTILIAIFFVGPRAGGGVLAAFGTMMLLHVYLHRHGVLGPTSFWRACSRPGSPRTLRAV